MGFLSLFRKKEPEFPPMQVPPPEGDVQMDDDLPPWSQQPVAPMAPEIPPQNAWLRPQAPPIPRLSPIPEPDMFQRQADAAAIKQAVQQEAQPARPMQAPPRLTRESLFGQDPAPVRREIPSMFTPPDISWEPKGNFFASLSEPEEPKPTFSPRPEPMESQKVISRHPEPGKPLFVNVEDYVSILDSIKDMRSAVKQFEDSTHAMDAIRQKVLEACKDWHDSLDEVHRKLVFIDQTLFEG